jgi:peptidoglycan-N-acetylglucosamine deacetylase
LKLRDDEACLSVKSDFYLWRMAETEMTASASLPLFRGTWTRWPLLLAATGKITALFLIRYQLASGLVLFFGSGCLVLYHLFVPAAQGLGLVLTRFTTSRREVWLTIDDGPDPTDTPRLLELLTLHRARATFFLIGSRAARHPELVATVLAAGHEVQHHTYSHPLATFWCFSPARVEAELDKGLEVLRRAGAKPRFFRAPVGIKNLFLHPALERRGLRCVAWSVRSRDCVARSAQVVTERVLRRVFPGAIILMHEGPSVPPGVRLEAIGAVLQRLAAEGYRCVIPPSDSLH